MTPSGASAYSVKPQYQYRAPLLAHVLRWGRMVMTTKKEMTDPPFKNFSIPFNLRNARQMGRESYHQNRSGTQHWILLIGGRVLEKTIGTRQEREVSDKCEHM